MNGRVDFDLHAGACAKGASLSMRLTPALVKAMLRREDELRLSESVQQEYGARPDLDGFVEITDGVQRRVCAEFGLEDDDAIAAALDAMRGCEALWPEHADAFRQISHYRRFNRARSGELGAHSPVPDVDLGSLTDTAADTPDTTLLSALAPSAAAGVPTLIVAGSYS